MTNERKLKNVETKKRKNQFFGFSAFRFLCLIIWISMLGFSAEAIPIITNVELTSVSDDSMVVTWSTTNEATTTEILYGIGGLTDTASVPGTTKYHYMEITGLYPNTTYQYRIKSGDTLYPPEPISPLTFKTLQKPSGEYLFSFAVLNDLRFAPSKTKTKGARGIYYEFGDEIISSEVADINEHKVAFTVINGNIADDSINYSTQISTDLKNILDNIKGANEHAEVLDLTSPAAYKYLPVPGYHDKQAQYSSGDDWITNSFDPLTRNPSSSEGRYKALYGYDSSSKDADSVFNYQFKYQHYNFIFLDSVRDNGTGLANLETVYNYLSAESNSKTFIFMSYPAYDIEDIEGEKDYPVDIPTEEVGELKISNHAAFRSIIEAFKDEFRNPIVAAVISGHLGDNYKRDINNISYVRQGPAVQYPTGYSIYKVYTNGYIKTFYKTKGRDSNDKPYYEHARDQISAEAGLPAEVLTRFWLGSNSMRNFTFTYPFIPGVSPKVLSTSPASGESAVSLNKPILITFNKRMYADPNLDEWVSISPSPGTLSASFIDADRSILKITHPDFTVGKTYTVTLDGSKAKDEGLTTLEADYIFTFNTSGGTKDEDPPTAVVNPLPDNVTTDSFPSFIGTASDESGVANIEYRIYQVDTGAWVGGWITAEAVDGTFNSSTEVFKIVPSTALSTGLYDIWIRTTDGVGNTTLTGFPAYSFTLAEEKPTISVRIDGSKVYPGDPISATPKIEITITAANSLKSGKLTLDSTTPSVTFVQANSNYYATLEVSTATALSDGIHGITIEAFDTLGKAATYEVYPLYVQSAADVTVQGVPLNYPNPFNPGDPNTPTTTIGYVLSKPSNITLSIFDLAGNLITKKSYSANQEGGRAGYNEVTWDGKSDTGDTVGNGIYIYLIIADGKVVNNGKGKITVFKQ